MSRPSHLPPRCPPQSRTLSSTRSLDSAFQRDGEPRAGHRRFPSQGSIIEEQPSWLDDLLSDPGTSQRVTPLRRTASDPVAILDACVAFHNPASTVTEGIVNSPDPAGGSGSGFEASCVYGPNSPRQKSRQTDSESSMVTALLENVPWNPLQYSSVDFPGVVGLNEYDTNVHDGVGDDDPEKATRRRSGQRSRVRKLQYIAELERSVDNLQILGAELAAQVAGQFQQRVALSMENKRLRQQVIIIRQEKTIKDGQHESLKKEVERLKMNYGRGHRRSRSAASSFETGGVETDHSGTSWQMLDMGMGKLSLGGARFL